jgi:hypothetical protein
MVKAPPVKGNNNLEEEDPEQVPVPYTATYALRDSNQCCGSGRHGPYWSNIDQDVGALEDLNRDRMIQAFPSMPCTNLFI